MPAKLGINGFGRIGRLALRNCLENPDGPQIVAINDAKPCEYLAYLFQYDSAHGKYICEIEHTDDSLTINGHTIKVFHTRDPKEIPWGELGAEIVLECTGVFLTAEKVQPHLDNGAKKVIFSAPAKDDSLTFVYGVNHTEYASETNVLSCASCTTNGLAPLVHIIHQEFGIEEGFMTTIHAATASQKVVDSTSLKDWRKGRAVGNNIIPTTTGAAKALAKVIPALKGKMTGMAFRVPTINVSVIDLTVKTEKETSIEEVIETIEKRAEGDMKGIMGISHVPKVSIDYTGEQNSSVLDAKSCLGLGPKFFKLVAWYDNEYGYAKRLVDLADHVAQVSGLDA